MSLKHIITKDRYRVALNLRVGIWAYACLVKGLFMESWPVLAMEVSSIDLGHAGPSS